jgi:alpha,alpha-trehalase
MNVLVCQLGRRGLRIVLSIVLLATMAPAASPGLQLPQPEVDRILSYINSSWAAFTASMSNCGTFRDPKTQTPDTLYLPRGFALPDGLKDLGRRCGIHIAELPDEIRALGQADVQNIEPAGLLYLPNPYVVPGGRFHEMYGWDSYFILRGLLEGGIGPRDGKLDLARGLVRNFFFEIAHYGGVLNANRTYYLTRSQPPFLTSMVLAVYDAEKSMGRNDLDWLREAYPFAVSDHALWMGTAHRAGSTGLARYFDFGQGPVPEMADAPNYYRGAAEYFVRHPQQSQGRLTTGGSADALGPVFTISPCPPAALGRATCFVVQSVSLTREFYKGDRSMRESGFDTTFRFGPYGADTQYFVAADLNSLLYKYETDLARIASLIGRERESHEWLGAANARRPAIDRYLWNATAGMFFDYDFSRAAQSQYLYASTFYPLWAGLASAEQAAALERHLKDFEQPGGLAMSTQDTGAQWDFPYGWAPIQLLAVEGLRRYGFNADADRISQEFLTMVLENFERDGTLREKYNVKTRASETHIQAGYQENVVGFGWTNAVFAVLYRQQCRFGGQLGCPQ